MPKKGFFVKNIIVIGGQGSTNGEHIMSTPSGDTRRTILNNAIPDPSRVNRIVKQIEAIALCAMKHVKPTRLTRVITDEFSFYTMNTPLAVDEYKTIINQLAEAFKNLPPNLIIIASSMPVLWPDGEVKNVVLHIQSPNDPLDKVRIHHMQKTYTSCTDPIYSGHHPPPTGDEETNEHALRVVLSGSSLCLDDPYQHETALIVQGKSLPPLIEAIDICLDHKHGVAMNNVMTLLRAHPQPPLYVCHIITSNSVYVEPCYLVAGAVHADHLTRDVDAVSLKSTECLDGSFGKTSAVFIYQSKRIELLQGKLFNIATRTLFVSNLAHQVDTYRHTLLHQILLKNKTLIDDQCNVQKRFKKLIPFFKGALLNQQNDDGDTPLHLAVQYPANKDILSRLLEQGARLDIKNNEGYTPIHIAHQQSDASIIQHLIMKLFDDEIIYINHREVILSILDELTSYLKDEAIDATIRLELSTSSPHFSTLIALLTQKTTQELLNLPFYQHSTDQHDAAFKQLLTSNHDISALNPDELNLLMAYLYRSPYKLQQVKIQSDELMPLIQRFSSLFSTRQYTEFQAWLQSTHDQIIVQTQRFSEQQPHIKSLSHLLRFVSECIDLRADCRLNNGLSIAEQLIAQLYLLPPY